MAPSEWNTTTPEEGAIVYVLAADNIGQYEIPFQVVFRDDSWWNARTGEELDTFIVGWRPADRTDPEERDRALAAIATLHPLIPGVTASNGGITLIRRV